MSKNIQKIGNKRQSTTLHWTASEYWASRCKRLDQQFAFKHGQERGKYINPDGSISNYGKLPENRTKRLFSGLVFHINGATLPLPSNELISLILEYCGEIDFYPSTRTNIIIANNLSNSKAIQYKTGMFKGIFVLYPTWVIDCVKIGQLLDPYEAKNEKKYMVNTEIDDTNWHSNIYKKILKERMKRNIEHEEADLHVSFEDIEFTGGPPENDPENDERNFIENDHQKDSIKKDHIGTCLNEKKIFDPIDVKTFSNPDEKIDLAILPKSFTDFDPDKRDIVNDFFEKSRLSKISAMRNEFSQYVLDLAIETKGKASAQSSISKSSISKTSITTTAVCTSKYVLHIDMDCFFVSVARKLDPSLIGKPVAVCYNTKNTNNFSASEISSCSYEARAKGVAATMYFGVAVDMCPDLVPTPYNFEEIRKVGSELYDIVIQEFGVLNVEAVSCDELYVNVNSTTGTNYETGDLEQKVQNLRTKIFTTTGCKATIGGGINTIIARCATKMAKPDGCLIIDEDNSFEFMQMVKFKDLPGIGKTYLDKLDKKFSHLKADGDFDINSLTCAGLVEMLELGQNGPSDIKSELTTLYGQDLSNKIISYINCTFKTKAKSPFNKEKQKNISIEMNYGIRCRCQEHVKKLLSGIISTIHERTVKISAVSVESVTFTLFFGGGVLIYFVRKIYLNFIHIHGRTYIVFNRLI